MPHEEDHGFWTDERERSHTGPIPRLLRTPRPASAKTGRKLAGNVFVDDSFSSQAYSRRAWSARDVNDHDLDDHDLDDHDLDHDVEEGVWNDHARAGNPWIIRRPENRRPNYALRRIAALVALGVVAAPIAVLIGGSDDRSPNVAAAEEAAVVQPLVEPGNALPNDAAAAVTVTIAVQDPATSASSAASTTTAALVAATASSTVAPATTSPPSAAIVIGATPSAQVRTEADTSAAAGVSSVEPTAGSPVADTVAPSCVSDYEIVAGDYWIQIADKVSVRLTDVLHANGANVDTPLYPGRTICLPANASAPTTDPVTTAAPTTTDAPTTTVKATTTTVQPTSTTSKSTSTSGTAATQAPSTTAAPPKNTYTRAQVEQIIRDVWPDDLEDEAIRIATRESNLVPTVRNSCCFGLFQLYWNVHRDWIAGAGVTSSSQLYDPRVNTYLAFAMYLRAGGWGPWT